MVGVNNPTVWVFTDVLVIACVAADFLQDIFLNQIKDVNRRLEQQGRYWRLGRTWTFTGFLFGMLLAAIAGEALMKLIGPSPSTTGSFTVWELTFDAVAFVAIDFYWHFVRKPKS
jgi:hypothetical protein